MLISKAYSFLRNNIKKHFVCRANATLNWLMDCRLPVFFIFHVRLYQYPKYKDYGTFAITLSILVNRYHFYT
jgi:hypothetical protein